MCKQVKISKRIKEMSELELLKEILKMGACSEETYKKEKARILASTK